MSTQERLETLHRILLEKADQRLYAVLDGASVPNLRSLLARHDVLNVCLFRGELDPELAQTAPYLVQLLLQSPFTELLLTQGFGNHWGIMALSREDFRTLRMHFRKFLNVWSPDGKPLYFRYYDPRVLPVYLPTCNAEELRTLFGPVTAYFAEVDGSEALARFTLSGDRLGQQQLNLSQNETTPAET